MMLNWCWLRFGGAFCYHPAMLRFVLAVVLLLLPSIALADKKGAGVGALLATADIERGALIFRICMGCHGRGIVAPNLWNIVGRRKASSKFRYSKAFKRLDGVWSYEELNTFLASPKAYAPGTMMKIKGIKKASDRLAVIAFLRILSDSPKPLQ